MKISDVKPIIDLCREKGVQAFKCPEFEFVLVDLPFIAKPKASRELAKEPTEDERVEAALFGTGVTP